MFHHASCFILGPTTEYTQSNRINLDLDAQKNGTTIAFICSFNEKRYSRMMCIYSPFACASGEYGTQIKHNYNAWNM